MRNPQSGEGNFTIRVDISFNIERHKNVTCHFRNILAQGDRVEPLDLIGLLSLLDPQTYI